MAKLANPEDGRGTVPVITYAVVVITSSAVVITNAANITINKL